MAFRQLDIEDEVTQVIAQNLRRKSVIIKNIGTTTAFLSQDRTNLEEQGFPLEQLAFFTLIQRDGDDPRMALYAQTAAGSTRFAVSESFGLEGTVLEEENA